MIIDFKSLKLLYPVPDKKIKRYLDNFEIIRFYFFGGVRFPSYLMVIFAKVSLFTLRDLLYLSKKARHAKNIFWFSHIGA